MIAGLVKARLDLKVHWTVPDYLQRSARHLASKTDLEQALAVGKAAVEYALAGRNGVMPVIERLSHKPYRWRIVPGPLEKIANHEKKMPASFIRADGYGITAACRRYLEPLIVGEAPPPYRADGVPDYFVPRLKAVRKRLPAFEA
jgi:6-phosphofructokinase 1